MENDASLSTDLLLRESNNNAVSKRYSDIAIQAVKVGNVFFSIAAMCCFLSWKDYSTVLVYAQICFLSVLVNLLHSQPGWPRRTWFTALILSGLVWTTSVIYAAAWTLPVFIRVLITISSLLYLAGTVFSAYVILLYPLLQPSVVTEISSASLHDLEILRSGQLGDILTNQGAIVVGNNYLTAATFLELDLLIYLVSLNVLNLFPSNGINLSLHMILDIRLVMLLYTGLHRPRDKLDLLRDPSFLVALVSIVLFFILFTHGTHSLAIIAVAYFVNMIIGLALLYQARYQYVIRYPFLASALNTSLQDMKERPSQSKPLLG